MLKKTNKYLGAIKMIFNIDFNEILYEDLSFVVKQNRNFLKKFSGKTILITGSTGLIGKTLVLLFLLAKEMLDVDLKIIAIARNKNKVKKMYSDISFDESFLLFKYQDIKEKIETDENIDYIYHTAAITDSHSLVKYPVEIFETQVLGMMNILSIAKLKKAKVLYFSSMEIYGQPFKEGKSSEDDLGYVNPLVLRNGYPESKRANEFLSSAYSKELGVETVNLRLAQTFGPGVQKDDGRVFAQFIRSALDGKDIVLHTDGSSLGNYCYLGDTLNAVLLLTNVGKSGESYNIVNESTNISIKKMAELVSTEFGNGKVVIDIPPYDMGYAPKVHLHLSSHKLETLGWKPRFDLLEMFSRTIKYYQS